MAIGCLADEPTTVTITRAELVRILVRLDEPEDAELCERLAGMSRIEVVEGRARREARAR